MAHQASSAARPKRSGEDFARAHQSSSKKPRFDVRNPSTLAADASDDDDEQDFMLEAGAIGKSGLQTKRNAVNIDGYESDSDNDNFNARAADRARLQRAEARSQAADEDDMFADLQEADGDEDEEIARAGKKSKKDVRFLEEDEIEGQDMTSKSGGHVSTQSHAKQKSSGWSDDESDSDASSVGDEERDRLPEGMDEEDALELGAGSKKRHAPKLDAFNMKEENEEGRFDESGNYVRKAADPEAINDNWLDGVSKKEIRRAKLAKEKHDAEVKKKTMENDAVLTSDLLSTLIRNLGRGETTLQALARLERAKPKVRTMPKWKQKRNTKDQMDVDGPTAKAAVDPAEAARIKTIEEISGAASGLTNRGHEIYEDVREVLMREFRRETGEDWQPAALHHQFEFKWAADPAGQVHGPYDAALMKQWNEEGYFQEAVEFRRVGEGEADWSRLLDLE